MHTKLFCGKCYKIQFLLINEENLGKFSFLNLISRFVTIEVTVFHWFYFSLPSESNFYSQLFKSMQEPFPYN